MRVVEDKEGKRCPSYYQSTGYYSEETAWRSTYET